MENPRCGNFFSLRRWLGRLSMSFLIVAACLAYSAWRGGQTGEVSHDRATAYYAGASVSFALFLIGTRERHRPEEWDGDLKGEDDNR